MSKKKPDISFEKIKKSVFSYSKLVKTQIEEYEKRVHSIENAINTEIENRLLFLDNIKKQISYFKANILEVKKKLPKASLNLKGINNAIKELDINNAYTYLDVIHEFCNVLKSFFSEISLENYEIENILDFVEDTIKDIIYLTEDTYTVENVPEILMRVQHLLLNIFEELEALGVQNQQLNYFKQVTVPLLNIVSLVLHKQQTNTEEEPNKIVLETDTDSSFKPVQIVNNVNYNFNNIVKQVNNILPGDDMLFKEESFNDPETEKKITKDTISFKKQDLSDIWTFSVNFLKPFDQNDFYVIEDTMFALQEKSDVLFHFLNKQFSNKPEITNLLENKIKPYFDTWLTLPKDFRANNWVEVIHVIVQNIQFSIKNTSSIPKPLVVFVNKLESILSTIDNDEYKVLIMPKEQPEIREVVVPDIFGINTPDTTEIEKNQKEEVTTIDENSVDVIKEKPKEDNLSKNEVKEEQVKENTGSNNDEAEEDKKEDPQLTLQSIIEFLCFDKTYGATANLDREYAEVIEELYHKEWLQNCLEDLEDKFTSFFTAEKFKDIWEDFKTLIFKEEGITLAEILNFLIDKLEKIITEGIDWLKNLIFFVVDEIFNLIKAIIAFFKDVDIPPEAKKLLKKLPPFKNISDDVSILHILLAIPYTLYKEFMEYEIPEEEDLKTA